MAVVARDILECARSPRKEVPPSMQERGVKKIKSCREVELLRPVLNAGLWVRSLGVSGLGFRV